MVETNKIATRESVSGGVTLEELTVANSICLERECFPRFAATARPLQLTAEHAQLILLGGNAAFVRRGWQGPVEEVRQCVGRLRGDRRGSIRYLNSAERLPIHQIRRGFDLN